MLITNEFTFLYIHHNKPSKSSNVFNQTVFSSFELIIEWNKKETFKYRSEFVWSMWITTYRKAQFYDLE